MAKGGDRLRVTVFFSVREDGGLRAWSNDVPELVLSHADPRRVLADVPVALGQILSGRHGRVVRVDPDGSDAVMAEILATAADAARAASHDFMAIAA